MLPSIRRLAATGALMATAAGALPQAGNGGSTACNNSPDLCSKSYSEVTHMGAHDSSFLRDASTDNSIAGTQYFNATMALDAGFRLLQAQTQNKNGAVQLCHTSCDLLDAGPLGGWLGDIKTWMDGHPDEVVTLLLVNGGNQDAAAFGSVFQGAGLDKYGYTPTGNGWPTLQEMISSNKRLVTFIASITANQAYPYLLPEFQHVFETHYEVTSLSGFNCTLDRPPSAGTASAALSQGLLPLMNHFAYNALGGSIMVPNAGDIDTTNSPSTSETGALGRHAQTCQGEWARAPSFILVDFWNRGPAIETADKLNGVQAAVGRVDGPGVSVATSAARSHGVVVVGAGRGPRHLSFGTGALVAFFMGALLLF